MNNSSFVEKGCEYLMNTYSRMPVCFVKGEGARVWDVEGREYLDFISGIAVNSVGHCNPSVIKAVQEQVNELIHCSNLYWNKPQIELAELLIKNSFNGKVFFCNSGAEANEAAIKLARKVGKKRFGRYCYEIIVMKNSFHGRTYGSLTATGQGKYHKNFEPLVPGFKYVEFNDINAIKDAINPNVCAIMLEPVQGEGGIIPADPEYLKELRKLCDQNNVLLIFDEVQCGLGRVGTLFAYQHYGVVPDIMTLAKALGGGLPIGAVVAKKEIADFFEPGDHASTFGGNPLVCSAGLAALREIIDKKLYENAKIMGSYFMGKINELREQFDVIKEVRGLGLMLGVELIVDAKAVVNNCFEKGLIINSTGNNTLRFVPPLTIDYEDIDKAIEILKDVFKNL